MLGSGENMTSYIRLVLNGEEDQEENISNPLQVPTKELVIFLMVVAVWFWACLLFYLRWKKLSRLETCQTYRPQTEAREVVRPEIVLSDQGEITESRRRPSHMTSVKSPLPSNKISVTSPLPSHKISVTKSVPSHKMSVTSSVPSHKISVTSSVPSHKISVTSSAPSQKSSVSSTLLLPNPAIPGRRPSLVLITDQIIMMKQQRNNLETTSG